MRTSYRLFMLAVLVALLGSPLWFGRSLGRTPSIVERFESLVVPTAAAAVIAPATVSNVMFVHQSQSDGVRLLIAGSMLFGLAAVVRKAI